MSLPKPKGYLPNPLTLGDHIKNTRLEKGLLQIEVAELFNIHVSSITNWEQNHHQPDIQYYPIIFKFLGQIPFDLIYESLGDRIRSYRILNGMSQERLANYLGINESTIFHYEKGTKKPKPFILSRLLKMLYED